MHCLARDLESTYLIEHLDLSLAINLVYEFIDQTGVTAVGFLGLRVHLWQKKMKSRKCATLSLL